MESIVGSAPKISSGINAVDEVWGGLYRGGSYLIYGRSAGGRGFIPLVFAQAAPADDGECLYIRSGDPNVVSERAASIGSDLQGNIHVMQLPLPENLKYDGDERLTRALADLTATAQSRRPSSIVIDDFMPFVRFRAFENYRASVISLLEKIDALDATLMILMAEPANDHSEKVIAFMRNQMTAAIHVESMEDGSDIPPSKLTLIPAIGHAGQSAECIWTPPHAGHEAADRVADPRRRFRFSDVEGDGPSPLEARWEDSNERTPQNGFRIEPDDRPHTGADRDDPFITPHRLGGSTMSQPADAAAIHAVPLGRARKSSSPTEYFTQLPRRSGEVRHEKIVEPPISTHQVRSHTDRESFRARLQQHFLESRVSDTPFLLIAMRMERRGDQASRPFDFEFMLDLVSELLRDRDDVFVDLDRERLIIMLAESSEEASQQFFARLKSRLREEAPQQADYLLQSVSAIIVPNGHPFQNAEEFLTYALDEI